MSLVLRAALERVTGLEPATFSLELTLYIELHPQEQGSRRKAEG